ncbi:MAG: hypothetical protein AB3N33_05680 [Puniceicoccaceae bacterium]
MREKKPKRDMDSQLAKELAEIDKEVGKWVAPAGQGADLKPKPETDAFTRQLMEDERAFLNPEEWGIDLGPIVKKTLSPPTDPDALSDWEVRGQLRCLVDLLARYHLCLTSSNHLSDRELYRHILAEVLPQPIGVGPNPSGGILYHECCSCESDDYLIYYADDTIRKRWAADFDLVLPEKRPLVSDRDIWIELLAESYRFEPLPQEDAAEADY